MTYNEIMKNVRCCADHYCQNCSLQGKLNCINTLLSFAWDAMYDQSTEIKNLQCINDHLDDFVLEATQEAEKEIFSEIDKIIDEIYNRHIFGNNELDDIEHEAIMNFSADISYRIDKLKQKYKEENL